MSLDTFITANIQQKLQDKDTAGTGDPFELGKEEFTGIVETAIATKSVLNGWIPWTPVIGNHSVSKMSVGQATVKALQRGVTPDGEKSSVDRISVPVETILYSRDVLFRLDEIQSAFPADPKIAQAQGEAIAKLVDGALFIKAVKAAKATVSPYGSSGFKGGNVTTVSDPRDPALVDDAILSLIESFLNKDVEINDGSFILALLPSVFTTLLKSEKIINKDYVTADGTQIAPGRGFILNAYGIPVVSTNNIPTSVITNHLLTTSNVSFDGDFTKTLGVMLSQKAVWGAKSQDVKVEIVDDGVSMHKYITSSISCTAREDRSEYAGVLLSE